MTVTLIGLGCGTLATATAEGLAALKSSDAIFGAPRLLKALEAFSAPKFPLLRAPEIDERIAAGAYERAAVVYSGDTGFYSGARLLGRLLEARGVSVRLLPGVSSVQYLAARLGRPWQDWALCSAHAGDCDVVRAVMQGRPAFFLTGGVRTSAALCAELCRAGLGALRVTVGERLSYTDERITECTAEEAAEKSFAPLSVLLAEAAPIETVRPGMPDDAFLRGSVPMTKRFVRAAVSALLSVRPDETVWDIGAGTGSVSVELSRQASRCYAVEREAEALELIGRNRARFGAWNLVIVPGSAPEALGALPKPDAVFIGGSGGTLSEILDAVLAANPAARICIPAVTLETLSGAAAYFGSHGLAFEVDQIALTRSERAGESRLMRAENPVFLITSAPEAKT